jgi:DNA-binding SARP family transcriptional activator
VLVFSVLGPLAAEQSGVPVRLGGRKQRAVLAMLLLSPNRVVPVHRLISGIWGEDPPDGAQATLQVYLSKLRALLGTPELQGRDLLRTRDPGYEISLLPEQIDLLRFERLVGDASSAASAGDWTAAEEGYRQALALWRGPAVSDLAGDPLGWDATRWLDEKRSAVQEEAFELGLRTGRHHHLVAEIEAAIAERPLSERLRGQLMVALYRCGRQGDALAAFRSAKQVLEEQLGIDPGPDLRRLEMRVLSQDPTLDLERPPSALAPEVGGTTIRRRSESSASYVLELPDGSTVAVGERTVVIGRLPGSDIVLADGDVSRRHAEVRPSVVGPLLVDLGSTNGTDVNGEPVVQRVLGDGDEIRVGSQTLVCRVRGDESLPTP